MIRCQILGQAISLLLIISFGSSVVQIAQAQDVWTQVSSFHCSATTIQINSTGTIFIGDLHNGVYRSTDGGQNWVNVSNGLLDSNVVAIAISPNDDIYVGTYGGGNNNPDRGLFRSTNNGETWTRLGADSIASGVWSIAFNSQGDILVGTEEQGVLYSSDSGTTWVSRSSGLPKLYVWSLAVDSRDRIYAGMWGGYIAYSTNNGIDWFPYDSGLTWPNFQCLGVDSNDRVYAGSDGGGLFSSDDSGHTWYHVTIDSTLAVNYIQSIVMNSLGSIFISGSNGPYRSRDGGTTWQQIVSGVALPCPYLALDSTGYLYTHTPQGIYRTVKRTTNATTSRSPQPYSLEILQNYPNPFNPSTMIRFSIQQRAYVNLNVFALDGANVATLVSENLSAGYHTISWNASHLSSGTYFLRLQTGHHTLTRKIILLK